MHLLFRFSLITALGASSTLIVTEAHAQEPGWTSRVLKLGSERELSEQTPILERPYRPLHFYGNTVRRNYYRGNPLPLPRDILITGAFLAPSSRERDIEREQRWGGFDYRLVETEDPKEKEEQGDAAEAEKPTSEKSPAEEGKVEQPTPEQPRVEEPALSQSGTAPQSSSRRQFSDTQSRRGRRGN